MEKQELLKQLRRERFEAEKRFKKARTRRTVFTILGFTVFYFSLFCWGEWPTFLEALGELLAAFVASGIHFLVNAGIFGSILSANENQKKYIADLEQRIQELENAKP